MSGLTRDALGETPGALDSVEHFARIANPTADKRADDANIYSFLRTSAEKRARDDRRAAYVRCRVSCVQHNGREEEREPAAEYEHVFERGSQIEWFGNVDDIPGIKSVHGASHSHTCSSLGGREPVRLLLSC